MLGVSWFGGLGKTTRADPESGAGCPEFCFGLCKLWKELYYLISLFLLASYVLLQQIYPDSRKASLLRSVNSDDLATKINGRSDVTRR